jgi:hypothetical protein
MFGINILRLFIPTEAMSEDYHHTMSNNLKYVQQMVLKDIDDIVSSMNKNIVIMDCQNSMIKILNRGITTGKLESSTFLVLMIQTKEVCRI